MCKKFKILIKRNTTKSCGNNYSAVDNKMYGFDDMTHIGMKGKLFGLFSDYFRMLSA